MALTPKDLETIIEAVKSSRVVDHSDLQHFSASLTNLEARVTSLHDDVQGLVQAWQAAGVFVAFAKTAAAVVAAIGVIGALILHPEVWFSGPHS
jgi:hypothetical protein